MEDATRDVACPIFPLFPEDGQCVVRRTAGVDDQRFGAGARRADMGAETVALPLQISHAAPALAVFHAVIVQAGFANRHHTGQRGFGQQVLHRGLLHALVVGVHAHRAPEVVVGQCQSVHVTKLFHGGADTQGPVHAGIGHRLANGRHLAH